VVGTETHSEVHFQKCWVQTIVFKSLLSLSAAQPVNKSIDPQYLFEFFSGLVAELLPSVSEGTGSNPRRVEFFCLSSKPNMFIIGYSLYQAGTRLCGHFIL